MSEFNDRFGAIVSRFSAIDADIERIANALCGPVATSDFSFDKVEIKAVQSRYGAGRAELEELIDLLELETRRFKGEGCLPALPCQARRPRFWRLNRRGKGEQETERRSGSTLERLFQQSDRIAGLLARLDERLEVTLAMLQSCAPDSGTGSPECEEAAVLRPFLFGVLSDAQTAQSRISARLRNDNRMRVALYDELTLSLRDGLTTASLRGTVRSG